MFRASLLVSSAPLHNKPLDRGLSGAAPRKRLLNGDEHMRLLLYNPDNGGTRKFIPHLWVFLLQPLTPQGPGGVLFGGQPQPLGETGQRRFVARKKLRLRRVRP